MLRPARPILQETLWGGGIAGALWPFQPLGWHYLRPLHLHDQPELLIVRRGRLRLTLGRETLHLRPGQLVWIAPSVAHTVDELSPDVDFWSLQLEPWIVERALARHALEHPALRVPGSFAALLSALPEPAVIEPTRSRFDAVEQAAHLAWSIYLARSTGQPPKDDRFGWIPRWDAASGDAATVALESVFRAALAAMLGELTPAPKKGIERLAFEALLAEPTLSRAELCHLLDVSEGHLSRRFPLTYGVGLANQRARLRLVRFVTLAKMSGATNLLRSSLQAGFGSYAQLHRVFTQHSAFAPSGYLYGGGHLTAGGVVRSG